jgi:tetratricopeptide (TPR) repeat protein
MLGGATAMMQKSGLVRPFLLVSCFLVLVACDGPKEREAAYLQRGKALFGSGNYIKARLELRNALQINPMGLETRYYLAYVEQKVGNFPAAYAGFTKIVAEKPDYLPAQIELARLLFLAGQHKEAKKKITDVLSKEPESGRARALSAAIAFKGGDLDSAMSEAQKALTRGPGNADAGAVVAGVLTQRGRPGEAIEALDAVIAQNADDVTLRLLKIRLHLNQNQHAEAESVFRELVQLHPKEFIFRIDLAKLLASQKQIDKAEVILRDALPAFPGDARSRLVLVDFLSKYRDPEKAKRELLGFIDEDPENGELLLGLARFYEGQKSAEKAEETYKKIIRLHEVGRTGGIARLALIRSRLRQGDKKSADEEIGRLLEADPSNGVGLILRATRSIEERKYTDAITDLRLILRDEPNSKEAMRLLSSAHLGAGNQKLASESLKNLLRVDSENVEARLQLAQISAKAREYEEAEKLLNENLVRKPNHIPTLRTKIEIAIVKREFNEAEEISKQLLGLGAPAGVARAALGRVYFAQAQYQDAIREFHVALEDDPSSAQTLTYLARSYVAARQNKRGIAYLQKFITKHESNPSAYDLLGQMSVLEGDLDSAARYYKRSAEITGDQSTTYSKYAQALLRKGHHAEAIAALLTALKANPSSEVILLNLAIAYQMNGDIDSSIDIYRRILSRNANLDAAANNLAALIADYRFQDKEALQEALALVDRFQTSKALYFLDTLGWVHYRLGNLEKSVVFLEQAMQSGQPIPALHYHLGMAYLAADRKDRAKEQLIKATQGNPQYIGVELARDTLANL